MDSKDKRVVERALRDYRMNLEDDLREYQGCALLMDQTLREIERVVEVQCRLSE